ncbi:MAG: FmdB family zinc ribbon protein [Kiritimatiellia bacterium]
MPIYEYRCQKCGRKYEHLAKSHREEAPPCPACGAPDPEKLLSQFAAHVAKRNTCDVNACAAGRPVPGCCPSGSCPLAQDK